MRDGGSQYVGRKKAVRVIIRVDEDAPVRPHGQRLADGACPGAAVEAFPRGAPYLQQYAGRLAPRRLADEIDERLAGKCLESEVPG